MITIDGSHGEGGGQILRTALALSTITQKPFEIKDIRKGRCDSGLKNQHLFCIKALERLCNAKTSGAFVGSENVRYEPGQIEGKTISIDIETAGSITLLLQSVLLPCFFADKKVRLKLNGGTDVKWSQPFDYFNSVLVPHLRKFADIDVKLEKRGYYPKGNGKVDIVIKPKYRLADFRNFDEFHNFLKQNIQKIDLTGQGNLIQIKGFSHASKELEKAEVAERQMKSAKLILSKLNCPVNISMQYYDALSTGSGITLWAMFSKDNDVDKENPIVLGSDSLGEQGKRAEIVGKEAAEKLIEQINSKAPVDEYLADQILPFMALTGGRIKAARITGHCIANIYVIEQFLGNVFEVDRENKIMSA